MPFTAPTLTQAQDALAARLTDPTFVYWTRAELTTYILEGLRVWNSWTSHWRARGTFNATQNEPFYDLPALLPAERGYTVTNWDLISEIQYALLEPPTPSAWSGTSQFTLADVNSAVVGRRDQFLQQTGAVLTRSVTAHAAPAATGRIDLAETTLTVHRAAWRVTATGLLRPLRRTDEYSANAYSRSWPTQTTPPSSYSTTLTPPITLQVIPPPQGAGSLDLLSVERGNQFTNPLVEIALGVPDDWSWVVKYGALADLLNRDGLALDTERAAYCQQRWEQGIALARVASVVLDARIDGVVARVGPLSGADQYRPLWQLVMGAPSQVLLAGQTIVALAPPPNGNQTILLDVVRNAPVPSVGADILQVSADLYDSVLDIAQHAAIFKQGAGQIRAGIQLLERAAADAGIALQIQQGSQPARKPTLAQTRADDYQQPRTLDPVPVE